MRGLPQTREESGAASNFSIALAREPSIPVPPPWGDKPISFLRDVQPCSTSTAQVATEA